MSLENLFQQEVGRLKRRQRRRLKLRIAALLIFVTILIGCTYLFRSSVVAIPTTSLVLIILGGILVFGLVAYVFTKEQIFHHYNRFSLLIAQSSALERLKQVKPKYFFGFSLLFIALIYQANPSLINNPTQNFFTRLVYQPIPPTLNSPWPWQNHQMIHPIVANMPSDVETSIKSVARYINQREPDPYLRIKALHDYVVSRLTYDLDVLETGIRPSQDAETVFHTHKAVCEGYANLFTALGQALGVKVVYIEGQIRQDQAPLNLIPKTLRFIHSNYDWTLHAWNAIKIANSWQLVDTTWDDDDSFHSKYRADYLMPPPKAMIISHLPNQPDWQLLPHSEDEVSFEKQPILKPEFFAKKLALITPTEYETNAQKSALIQIRSYPSYQGSILAFLSNMKEDESLFSDFTTFFSEEASQEKKYLLKQCQTQKNRDNITQISCEFIEPGIYQVFLFTRLGQQIIPLGQLKFHSLDRQ